MRQKTLNVLSLENVSWIAGLKGEMTSTALLDEIMEMVKALPEEGQRELLIYLKSAAAARRSDSGAPEERGAIPGDAVDPNGW